MLSYAFLVIASREYIAHMIVGALCIPHLLRWHRAGHRRDGQGLGGHGRSIVIIVVQRRLLLLLLVVSDVTGKEATGREEARRRRHDGVVVPLQALHVIHDLPLVFVEGPEVAVIRLVEDLVHRK